MKWNVRVRADVPITVKKIGRRWFGKGPKYVTLDTPEGAMTLCEGDELELKLQLAAENNKPL